MGFFSSLPEIFSRPTPAQGKRQALNDLDSKSALTLKDVYDVDQANWYTAKPYGFKMNTRDGAQYVMFLPISPSNITISTPFATNLITTLYGTVEEHTNNRYFDIVIEGTTGMAPSFVEPLKVGGKADEAPKIKEAYSKKLPGRASYPLKKEVALGGFFQNTVAQAANVYNQSKKVVQGVKGLFGSNEPSLETALYVNQTGYAAFHNLYRFLMKHKSDVSGLDSKTRITKHPLTFFNYKDNNQYDVVIRSFTLRRTAENPMLYFYSISMRGYNLTTCGLGDIGKEDLSGRLQSLGLDGVKPGSVFSQAKNISGAAKNALGSLQNGINIFGS